MRLTYNALTGVVIVSLIKAHRACCGDLEIETPVSRSPCMAQDGSSLQAALAELEKSFGHSSFKSDLQKEAILSINKGK